MEPDTERVNDMRYPWEVPKTKPGSTRLPGSEEMEMNFNLCRRFGSLRWLILKEFQRLLHLSILGGWLNARLRWGLAFLVVLIRLGNSIVVVPCKVVRVDAVSYFRTLHFNRRRHT